MRYRLAGQNAHKILISLALSAWLSAIPRGAAAGQNPRPENWAKPVASAVLPNWYRLDDGVYRSRQPDRKGFEEAQKKGIRTVINLRSDHSDAKLVEGLGLNLVEIPMTATGFTEDHILRALKAIQASPKPVLIHCQHGADRAGVVSAAYRVVVQGWPKDEAISELKKGGFGFHWFYVNIPAFIKDMDVAAFRARLTEAGPAAVPAARPSLNR